MTQQRDRMRQFYVMFFAVGQWVSSFLIASQFNEQNEQAAPDYFVPTDATFAVWGFIYSGATIYALYQLQSSQRERAIHRRIGWWIGTNYVLCSVWNGISITPAGYYLTVPVIFAMLATLIVTWSRLQDRSLPLTRADQWLALVPHALYFAWLNLAPIANTATALVEAGFTGEPNGAVWSAAMIGVATIIVGGVIVYSRANVGLLAYVAVVVWALVGIYIENNPKDALVGAAAIISGTVILATAVFRFINDRSNRIDPRRDRPVQQRAGA
jgi:hypothetical protein